MIERYLLSIDNIAHLGTKGIIMTNENLIELFTKHNIADKDGLILKDFQSLIINTKNRSVTSRPADVIIGESTYSYCRNSGHYFLLSDMTFDKNGKNKGMSKYGASLYNAAQKAKKSLISRIDSKKSEYIALPDKTTKKVQDEVKSEISKLETELTDNKWADGQWMWDTFLGGLKPDRITEIEDHAYTLEKLEEMVKSND